MRFKEISVEDYRQFCGKHRLAFASGKETNITLIHGANGAGKTNLFESINWCLYGEFFNHRGAIISKEKALPASYGDVIECTVSIWYSDEGNDYLAVRKGRAKKIKAALLSELQEEESAEIEKYRNFDLQMLPAREEDFQVFRKTDAGMDQVKEPRITIDRALPENARQYFLFDGEKIERLSRPEHDHEVKEAVRNVLQLPTIERAMEHLGIMKKEFVSKAKTKSMEENDEELIRQKEDIDTNIAHSVEKQKDIKDKMENVTRVKTKLDDDLRRFESVKELIKRRDDLQKSYDDHRQRILKIKNGIANILSSSHLILSRKATEKAFLLLDEKRKKGQIPPAIRETFVLDLLKRGECICGNDLKEGSQGSETITRFMNESRTETRIAEELLETYADLNQIFSERTRSCGSLKDLLADWIETRENLEDIASRLEDIHSQVKKVSEADIRSLEERRRECEEDERRFMQEHITEEVKLEEFNLKKAEVEKRLEKIIKSKSISGEFMRLARLTDMCTEVFQRVYERFAQKKRIEVESKLKEIFERLIWKKDQFPGVHLTENYVLQLYDKYGSPARSELSAGETQILSLSFITAMAFVSGGTIPLVMDTPFGRLQNEHKTNIVNEVPQLTNQWILFVQDGEINAQLLETIRSRLGKEYRLYFHDGCSTIEEI